MPNPPNLRIRQIVTTFTTKMTKELHQIHKRLFFKSYSVFASLGNKGRARGGNNRETQNTAPHTPASTHDVLHSVVFFHAVPESYVVYTRPS